MILQKLITYFSFLVLNTTNNTLKDKHTTIFKKVLNIPNKFNKKIILAYLYDLYKDLTLHLEENNKLLSRKEKSYINALRNFILQLRRYFKIQSGKEFPAIVNNLQDKELLLGIEELSKKKRISKEVILLNKPFVFEYKVLQPGKKGKNPFKKKVNI